MKTEVLAKILDVVHRGITDGDDFRRFRLPQLASLGDDEGFVLGFSKCASHFFSFSEDAKRKDLEMSEAERFRFMQCPVDDLESFIYLTQWTDIKSLWTGKTTPSDVVLFYDGTDIVELSDEDKVTFPGKARKMWLAVSGGLQDWVRKEWPDEVKYYKAHIPVNFTSPEIRKSFLEELHSENGADLMKVCKRLQGWQRLAVNQKIYISYDFCPHSFSFCECVNDKPHVNGGIIYDKDSKTWSTHT